MGPNETREIAKITRDYSETVGTHPLQRCSEEGVDHFITREASSYQTKNIGTINNSVAKKAVDAELRILKKEIVSGIPEQTCHGVEKFMSTSEMQSSYDKYPSEISFSKIKDLLVTRLSDWCFQTTNSGELTSFFAKSPFEKMELFVNFKNNGDTSHICLGPNFGYIQPEDLSNLKSKLTKVFSKITEDLEKKVILDEYNQFGCTTRMERFRMKDPEYWYQLKEEALAEFLKIEEVSFFEKVLSFFDPNNNGHIFIQDTLKEETLNDNTIAHYLLDNIKIDIKQVYA